MARLIFSDGSCIERSPKDGNRFTLCEIRGIVGNSVRGVPVADGRVLFCEPSDGGVFFSIRATKLLPDNSGFNVGGTAILVDASELPESESQ